MRILFIAVFLFLFSSAPSPAAEINIPANAPENDALCQAQLTSPWPLKVLNGAERKARIQQVLQGATLKFDSQQSPDPEDKAYVYSGAEANAADCSALAKKVKNLTNVEILEPIAVNDYRCQAHDAPWKKECATFIPNKIYDQDHAQFAAMDDPIFRSLTPDEKAKQSKYTEQASFGEYYDLGKYFGAGIWGFLEDGVRLSCQNPEDGWCKKRENYE